MFDCLCYDLVICVIVVCEGWVRVVDFVFLWVLLMVVEEVIWVFFGCDVDGIVLLFVVVLFEIDVLDVVLDEIWFGLCDFGGCIDVWEVELFMGVIVFVGWLCDVLFCFMCGGGIELC